MASPDSRFQKDQRVLYVGVPVKDRFDTLKRQLENDKHRQVTQTEVIELLLDHWDVMEKLAADTRKTSQ